MADTKSWIRELRWGDPSLEGLRPFSLWDWRAFLQDIFGPACEISLLALDARFFEPKDNRAARICGERFQVYAACLT